MITLVTPFPQEHVSFLWSWLNEFPLANFDDSAPTNVKELAMQISHRSDDGDILWEVQSNSVAVGAIGFRQVTPELGVFRGICFTQYVHGTGIPREAVSVVLDSAFNIGVQAVRAEYFASNKRVQRFLEKFGGTVCDYIRCGSLQNGVPIDWKVTEILQPDYVAIRRNQKQDVKSD